jgi:hypothetical protein
MKKTNEQPLTKLADAAFEQAALKVIKRAEDSGTPVILWENHQVKQVEPPKGTGASRKGRRRKAGGA